MRSAGLTHGVLNDRLQFDTVVSIASGRREAHVRGIELGLLGDADKGEAYWEVAVYDNRFVKEDGLWKVRENGPRSFRWWGYKNPVRGRQPELFLPDCVPCQSSQHEHGEARLFVAADGSGEERGLKSRPQRWFF